MSTAVVSTSTPEKAPVWAEPARQHAAFVFAARETFSISDMATT